MSASIMPPRAEDPAAAWPGFAAIDAAGARIAREMLAELEGADMDAQDIIPAEYCQLPNWPRQGRPFRNIIAEYAERAQGIGPEALSAFYAVLSDFVACARTGAVPDTDNYDALCGPEDPAQ